MFNKTDLKLKREYKINTDPIQKAKSTRKTFYLTIIGWNWVPSQIDSR